MGRNKIKIERIENERVRQVTFYKRKRGLLKKSMELSVLCDSKILLCVLDKNEKMMIYASDGMTIKEMQRDILSGDVHKEYFTNDEYKELFEDSSKPTEQFSYTKENKISENSDATDNDQLTNTKSPKSDNKKASFGEQLPAVPISDETPHNSGNLLRLLDTLKSKMDSTPLTYPQPLNYAEQNFNFNLNNNQKVDQQRNNQISQEFLKIIEQNKQMTNQKVNNNYGCNGNDKSALLNLLTASAYQQGNPEAIKMLLQHNEVANQMNSLNQMNQIKFNPYESNDLLQGKRQRDSDIMNDQMKLLRDGVSKGNINNYGVLSNMMGNNMNPMQSMNPMDMLSLSSYMNMNNQSENINKQQEMMKNLSYLYQCVNRQYSNGTNNDVQAQQTIKSNNEVNQK